MIDDVVTNDGKMLLEIVETSLKKDGSAIMKSGNYTVYRIRGKDSLGPIAIDRRYREFLMFRDTLFQRYPGLYIPPVPYKQL